MANTRSALVPTLSFVPAAVLAGLMVVWAPSVPASEAATPTVASADLDAEALTRLVHQDCGSCHGLTLKGGLGPDIRPQSLTHFDADILQLMILDGVPDTAMPPWRPLISEDEALWIANYLLTGKAP